MSQPVAAPCVVHVLVPRASGETLVLAGVTDGRLPRFELAPEAGDTTGAILAALRAAAPFDGYLSVQPVEHDVAWRTTRGLAEVEPLAAAPAGFAWRPVAEVAAAEPSEAVKAGLGRWIEAVTGPSGPAAPWFAPGWRRDATAWIEDRLRELGRTPAGSPALVHGGPVSVVLRAEASGGPVYFKASVPHFAQEATIAAALAARTPGWVPNVLAADPAVGILMAPMPGRPLDEDPPGAWAPAMQRLAELQLAWVGHADELAAAGAQVRPLRALAALVDDAEPVFDALVHLEPDAWPAWRDLAPRLRDRVLALDASPLPDTLVHGDLHPGNVNVEGDAMVVFDWSDGALTNPFVDLVVALRNTPDPVTRRGLLDAYLAPWSAGYERATLERAADDAAVAGAVYQVATYLALVPALDVRDRWQFAGSAPRWLRAALRPPEVAPGS